jgi:hypothetical protein
MLSSIKPQLVRVLNRELILDLDDRLRAAALKAFEMVRDGSGLDKKRSRELEGQARFRMMEQGFEEVCQLHGGRALESGIIPNTDLKIFQPFMRFENAEDGVILGLAAAQEPGSMPLKNKSRLAGVSINYHLSPRLDLDGSGPKVGDIFAMLLFARHRENAGKLQELAVGVVDANYGSLLFYEPFEEFAVGERESRTQEPAVAVSPVHEPVASVSLKVKVIPFIPPESARPNKKEKSDA